MARPIAFLLAVLITFAGITFAQHQPAAGDVSGVYRCEGKNPDGSPYQGVVEIAAVGGTYLVRWTLSNRVEVWGVGILRHDSLSVSYFGGTPAIVVYDKDGERLVGEWTMGGAEGALFTETLTKVPGKPTMQPRERREPREPNTAPESAVPSGIRL